MLYEDKIARPYTFDLDLDTEGAEIQKKLDDHNLRKDALDNPPVLVTEEEALKWKQQGYDDGYTTGTVDGNKAGYKTGYDAGKIDGHNDAISSIEQKISDTLIELSHKLDEGRAQFEILDERFEKSSISIAIKLLHLFAPIAARENALLEIEGVINQTLRDLIHEPRLIIRVCEDFRDSLSERIETLINTHGFDGKITVLGDKDLVNADLIIQWEDGGIERTEKNIWLNLNDAISKFLGTAPVGSSDLDETVRSLITDMKQDITPDTSFDIQPHNPAEIPPATETLEASNTPASHESHPEHHTQASEDVTKAAISPTEQDYKVEEAQAQRLQEPSNLEVTASPSFANDVSSTAETETVSNTAPSADHPSASEQPPVPLESSQAQEEHKPAPNPYDWEHESPPDGSLSNTGSDDMTVPASSSSDTSENKGEPENKGVSDTQSPDLKGSPLLEDNSLEDWTDSMDWDEQIK